MIHRSSRPLETTTSEQGYPLSVIWIDLRRWGSKAFLDCYDSFHVMQSFIFVAIHHLWRLCSVRKGTGKPHPKNEIPPPPPPLPLLFRGTSFSLSPRWKCCNRPKSGCRIILVENRQAWYYADLIQQYAKLEHHASLCRTPNLNTVIVQDFDYWRLLEVRSSFAFFAWLQ